jgi:tRNA (adenine37-N6)-methyltransferase
MNANHELMLRPIGRVSRGRPRPPGDICWDASRQEAEIELEPAWTEALDGVEGFSHLWVVWWLDRAAADSLPAELHVHPEGRPEMPEMGLFATRTPRRPNPIALTAVHLLERRGNWLRVTGLDAYEGTPILDLKPYLHRGDLIIEATAPDWLERLWEIHDQEQDQP